MGTMNFSIPDDVKYAFNEAFKDENKSAIVTELLRRAIEDKQRKLKNESFLDQIRANRAMGSRGYSEEEIRKAREEGRH